jgi:hypothetical protein
MKKLYNNFYREIRRLRSLYYASLIAFEGQKTRLKDEMYKKYDPKEKVYYKDIIDDNYLISGSYYELSNKYKSGFPKTLREIILIRSISALEVLFIGITKEIFLLRKDLFHDNQKVEFTQAELLSSESITEVWSKIINKETRKLQNQGILEIEKYFRNNFSIDFNKSPIPFSSIKRTYDIRHLFVHRLGKTDKHFRHKYNVTTESIVISEKDLQEILFNVIGFGNFVYEQAIQLINAKIVQKDFTGKVTKYMLSVNSDENPDIVNANYSFLSGDNVYNLRDILKEFSRNDNIVQIKVAGDSQVLKDYRKLLLKKHSNGEIVILNNKKKKTELTSVETSSKDDSISDNID